MTVPNLKLFLKFLLPVLLIAGCGASIVQHPPYKCQAVVVVDKTNSVSFNDRISKLQQALMRNFQQTYGPAERDIQSSRLVITGNTSVFPDFDYFDNCPEVDLDSRSGQVARQKWIMAKRKWIYDEVNQIVSLMESPCNNNTTDIFSIFGGIQQVQKRNGPWDTVNVFIFSDMINTCSPINMMSTEVTVNNAFLKGKKVCQHLIDQGQISRGGNENLYLTIYPPNNMKGSAKMNLFWKGFFEQWGLQEAHYHFE